MTTLTPNATFNQLASQEQIARTVEALSANGMTTLVAENGDQARLQVLDLLPDRTQVFTAKSKTLEQIGLSAEIEASPHLQSVRARLLTLDRQTQDREMRQVGSSPDVVIGSVHAITAQGQVLVASASGSQMASYVYGAGKVIWVVGTQKLVKDLEEGMSRINEYAFPLEDARIREVYGRGSVLAKILLVQRELIPGRTTIVLVKENLGY